MARRGTVAHPDSEDTDPPCTGELGWRFRERRAADTGCPGLGWVGSTVATLHPLPSPRVSVASFPRSRGGLARATFAAGETRGEPFVGAAAVALTTADTWLSRRVRAPQPGIWGAPHARLFVGQPSSPHMGRRPGGGPRVLLQPVSARCPLPPTLRRLSSLTFRGEI